MKRMMRFIPMLLIAMCLTACGGSSSGGSTPSVKSVSGTISLSPQGSQANPSYEGCRTFTVSASEAGYAGSFTISMSGGNNGATNNYALPQKTTTSGNWLISPGALCLANPLDPVVTQFTIIDSEGNSAETYVL
jgi:hypothetical protein